MITDSTTKTKKRTPTDAKSSTDEGDHRKKRRNRTTQSCLNCHTSKRMCDRRRPACSRCTQLGLTGLCVYEVDDPNQRPDLQDESSRLLKRVAELEGVIRELKNKPHPRWVQPREDSVDKPPFSGGASPNARTPARESPLPSTPTLSSPSPGSSTPSSDSSHSLFNNRPVDLTTLFSSYPTNPVSPYFARPPNSLHDDSVMDGRHSGRCSCLTEPDSYNTLLELSLRLRKAAQVMAQSRSHRMGSSCTLLQRIAELDTYTSDHLTSLDYSAPQNATMTGPCPHGHFFDIAKLAQTLNAPASSPVDGRHQSWDMLSPNSYMQDDPFMMWEPSSSYDQRTHAS
ncbi:hypothetical protein PM082_000966 [Marasmius tenuissimus]|nr:hypothetical protein PM082_000966 [Marasmius tenuissimus]